MMSEYSSEAVDVRRAAIDLARAESDLACTKRAWGEARLAAMNAEPFHTPLAALEWADAQLVGARVMVGKETIDHE